MRGFLPKLIVCLCAALAAAALSAPTASAQQRCLYQGLKATPKTLGKVERSLLCLTNLHRHRNGLALLKRDARLGVAARGHSHDMVARNYFDHFTPEGTGPSGRARAAGYPGGAGENIAANGTGSALSLFAQWLGSPGHNRNMLEPRYRAAGFGVALGFPGARGGGVTGTQMFGFAQPNTGDAALDLYANSRRCAKAKLAVIKAKKKKKKKKLSRKQRRKLGKAKRARKRACKPL